MAFNSKARYAIKERANGMSEISGKTGHLNCAHIDHFPNSGYYNQPFNGVLMAIDEHLIDHLARKGQNGLTVSGNFMAIAALTRSVESVYGRSYLEAIEWLGKQRDFQSDWQKRIMDLRISWLCNVPPKYSLFKLTDYVTIV